MGPFIKDVRQIRVSPNLVEKLDVEVMAFVRILETPENDLKVQLLVSIDREDAPVLNPSF